MKRFLFLIFLLFILLFFHEETILGTETGLLLWYQTLIPSLLPFIILTNALFETNAYQVFAKLGSRLPSGRLYEIMAILFGNLCGYPIGGKIINDFACNHYLSEERSIRILALASQASPMFITGFIYLHILNDALPLSVFLISIYVPVFVKYCLLPCPQYSPSIENTKNTKEQVLIRDTFLHSVEIMVLIGIYVILFSILLKILLPFCKYNIQKILLSFLEITTGLNLLYLTPLSEIIKTSLICALTSFGGLCNAFQVKAVIKFTNVQIKKYLFDKFILSAGTFCIVWFYLNWIKTF